MKLKDVFDHLATVVMIVIAVLLLMVLGSHFDEAKDMKYPQVQYINDTYADDLKSLGVDRIHYYDWEETANALNVSVDSLTPRMFMQHMHTGLQ